MLNLTGSKPDWCKGAGPSMDPERVCALRCYVINPGKMSRAV